MSLSARTSTSTISDAEPRSIRFAYFVWLLLGVVGGHRFYLGHLGAGAGMLVIMTEGMMTALVGGGFIVMAMVGAWAVVDVFFIPAWVRAHNLALARTAATS